MAVAVIRELGWWCVERGAIVRRLDERGCVRSFHLGFGSKSILYNEWLIDWRRRAILNNALRVRRLRCSLRRREDQVNLAQGAALPGVPPNSLCVYSGHRKIFSGAGSRYLRNSALATGCSVWANAKKRGVQVDAIQACMYRAKFPSLICFGSALARLI